MAAYIAIFLSIVCIVLLIAVLIRFEKLFSTKAIIENTQNKMNKIISDINNNANRDIDLINEATRRTRALIKETDDKMNEFKEASQILRDMIATVENKTKESNQQIPIFKASLMDEIKPVGQVKGYNKKEEDEKPIVNKSTGKAASIRAQAYTTELPLFDNIDKEDEELDTKNKNFVALKNKDDEVKEGDVIPNIVTNIVAPSNFVTKKSLKDRVMRLFSQGMNVEDIALDLSCSVTEVQFIIDMQNQ